MDLDEASLARLRQDAGAAAGKMRSLSDVFGPSSVGSVRRVDGREGGGEEGEGR
ncbi:hypothetical protein Tdes44962_MAKER10246 [Teratosphaeria destructans]|uniref:Uncharacterized protein n=1 Tax=Teratosphaeria destructans TaxID=418781 RepID=A0A9W7SMT9_9PEZI|nr:hypothetical protein Tdes44962_MAKER10246 [Teratosphaeria destructans]